MDKTEYIKALEVMTERFGHDSLISVATIDGDIPAVRTVNSYYENGAFYTITSVKSNKIKQIEKNPVVAICGEWFTAHGVGENMGYVCAEQNIKIAEKLRKAFLSWYSNGHVDESNPNTVILRMRLTDAVLFSHGIRYNLDFSDK
jgi:general stress protein 26